MPRVARLNAGHVAPDHPAVEDDRGVRSALVGLEELDDRVAAGLLLAVAAEADVDRQLAGLRELARSRRAACRAGPCRRRRRGRRGSRRGSRARTAATPRARAGRAAARRSGRNRGRSARCRRSLDARISPIASGCPCQSTSSHSPPASRMKSHTHSARARRRPCARVGADRRDAEELRQLVEPLHAASLAARVSTGCLTPKSVRHLSETSQVSRQGWEMSRARRSFVPGGIYHLTAHGLDDRPIFLDDADRQSFALRLRAGRIARSRWRSLRRLPDGHALPSGAPTRPARFRRNARPQRGTLACFNARHGRRGALFEARYFERTIRGERHLASAVAYVEHNAVAAGLVSDPADWPWSTYPGCA